MSTFNPDSIQTGDGNLSEPVHVGRPGQQVIFSNVTPSESYAAKYPTIESVPDDFNGEVEIVTPNYRATVKGDGTTKIITGYSDDIAYKPIATIGKINWWVGATQYISNGNAYTLAKGAYPTLKWDAAYSKAINGIGNARVLWIGDSTGAGTWANGSAWAGNLMKSAFRKLQNSMRAPISVGNYFGDSNAGANFLSYETRIAFTGTWVRAVPTISLGYKISYTAGDLAKLTFTPAKSFDSIDVYYVSGSAGTTNSQVFTVDIGGAVLSTVNSSTANPAKVERVTVPCTAGADGAVSVNIIKTGATGFIYIVGISCYLNNSQIQLLSAAESDQKASGYFLGVSYGVESAITAVTPDLTIINLGINDANPNLNIATFETKYQQIIDYCKQYGDVALCIPNPIVQTVTTIPQTDYWDVIWKLADENSLNVFDFYTKLGSSWSVASANGLMRDNLHPLEGGYQIMSDVMYQSGLLGK